MENILIYGLGFACVVIFIVIIIKARGSKTGTFKGGGDTSLNAFADQANEESRALRRDVAAGVEERLFFSKIKTK
jgi:hypothetical protein